MMTRNWNELLDGKIWELEPEDMGKASLKTMRALLWRQARNRGMKVRTGINPKTGYLVIQAYKPDADQKEEQRQLQFRQEIARLNSQTEFDLAREEAQRRQPKPKSIAEEYDVPDWTP